MPLVLAAPDKFRGTATAVEAAHAIAAGARAAGWDVLELPISDGGEGLLDCFGGANRHTTVTGPVGAQVSAGWRLDGTRAVIELAAASGQALLAGRPDPLNATTRGTGELVRTAIEAGARTVVVGAGGSASTDGGLGAVEVLRDLRPLDGTAAAAVTVAADVRTGFLDAARIFAPQKGAGPSEVTELEARLRELAGRYRADFGIDVTSIEGSGAAGGFAGGLAALGATIGSGFDVVAEQLRVAAAIERADIVITGEGRLDETSFAGKAVGGIAALAAGLGKPVVALAGAVAPGVRAPFDVLDLTASYGAERAHREAADCLRAAAEALLHGRRKPE